jgi:poly-gamma-glutamate synthesis protein (capsule biosynthesis protein)
VLPDDAFRQLQSIDEMLGTAASRREVAAVEVMKDPGPDRFAFGSVFEGSLQIERGERAHVRYFMESATARRSSRTSAMRRTALTAC